MLSPRALNSLSGFSLAAGLMLAIGTHADQLTIDVLGIERPGGTMMVAIFDSATSWENSNGAVSRVKSKVTGPSVTLLFSSLATGSYAVKLYHDENDDGVLGTNMLGVPTEGYGFSNNPQVLGEPDFEEAMFLVDGDTHIEITLN